MIENINTEQADITNNLYFSDHIRGLKKTRASKLGFSNQLIKPLALSALQTLEDLIINFKNILVVGEENNEIKKILSSSKLAIAKNKKSKKISYLCLNKALANGDDIVISPDPHNWSLDNLKIAGESPDAIIVIGFIDSNNYPELALSIFKSIMPPDCPVIGSFYGGNTLSSFSQQIINFEQKIRSQASYRVHPMIDVRACANLLMASGFNMPVIDIDKNLLELPSLKEAVNLLRKSGESNCTINNKNPSLPSQILKQKFKVTLDFDIINFIAWTPSKNQPKALAKGSAKQSLKDFL